MKKSEVTMLLLDETRTLSPRPVISEISHNGKRTFVVRDDLLPGGTKQRAAGPYIRDMMKQGHKEFIYASPFSGFAQVALASICRILGARCTIVCEKDQRYQEKRFHPFSELAGELGAKLIMARNLNEAEEKALSLSGLEAFKIPLGFDCHEFREHLAEVFRDALSEIELSCGNLKNIWVPVGSGTLARTLLTVIPNDIVLHGVNVRVLEESDYRLEYLKRHPSVKLYHAPVPFPVEARDIPEIPSNVFYDAKLWAFIKQHGNDGDVWWNVAR